MSTRQEVQQRREAMRQALIDECRNTSALASTLLPPLHELARRHGLSVPLVSATIRELVKEGVLHTRQGAGTYVGKVSSGELIHSAPFLLVMFDDGSGAVHRAAVRRGFEDGIAQLSGSSLFLSVQGLRQLRGQGELLAISGILDYPETVDGVSSLGDFAVPRVTIGVDRSSGEPCDNVDFDNVDGGRQATEHLFRLGHERVAFLGLHESDSRDVAISWSAERANGWRQVAESARRFDPEMLFTHASLTENYPDQLAAAKFAAAKFVRAVIQRGGSEPRGISAVVVVNHIAAYELLNALAQSGLPSAQWPSIVTFDEQSVGESHILSTMRLPWEEVGREAANLLGERSQGFSGPPAKRLVTMKLISRLTSQKVWSGRAGAIALAVPGRILARSGDLTPAH